MATIKKAQGGDLIKKALKAVGEGASKTIKGGKSLGTDVYPKKTLAKKVKEADFQKNKGKFGMEGENVTLKDFSKKELSKKFGPPADYTPKSTRPMLTDAQKANNARILQEIKDGKRKNGGPVPKAQIGKMIKKGVKAISNEASAIKSGIKKGVEGYKKDKFFSKLRDK